MKEEHEHEFRALCERRGLAATEIEAAVEAIQEFEAYLHQRNGGLGRVQAAEVTGYVSSLVASNQNTEARLVALTRFFFVAGLGDAYICLVAILSGRRVIQSLAARTETLAGEAVRRKVFGSLRLPPLGAPASDYPAVTKDMVERLFAHTSPETAKDILSGNHHGVPKDSFTELHRRYLTGGIDVVLRYRHESLIAELEACARSGKLWYEQNISPEVVAWVRENPEIQAGVRTGEVIHVTKIPYDPIAYLSTEDPVLRRYYQCHCPLARASIIGDGPRVPPRFCYCSGGYEKLPFDVIFAQSVEVRVLESALGGDQTCRFAIKVPPDRPVSRPVRP